MIVIDRSVGSLSLDLGIGIAMLERLRDILAFNEEIEQLCQMRNKSCSYHHILRCSGRAECCQVPRLCLKPEN